MRSLRAYAVAEYASAAGEALGKGENSIASATILLANADEQIRKLNEEKRP